MTTQHDIDPDDVFSHHPGEAGFDVVVHTLGGTPFTVLEGLDESVAFAAVLNLRGALGTYPGFVDQGAADRGWTKA